MNILSIGNSFAMDTMQHMADIARSAGICDFTYALLYIGGLTFLKTLCGLPMEAVTWRPEEVTAEEAEVAKKAAEAAVKRPFAVTEDFM